MKPVASRLMSRPYTLPISDRRSVSQSNGARRFPVEPFASLQKPRATSYVMNVHGTVWIGELRVTASKAAYLRLEDLDPSTAIGRHLVPHRDICGCVISPVLLKPLSSPSRRDTTPLEYTNSPSAIFGTVRRPHTSWKRMMSTSSKLYSNPRT